MWVILATVNPTILNLDALKFSELKASDAVQGVIDQNRDDAIKRSQETEAKIKQLIAGEWVEVPNNTLFGRKQKRDLEQACREQNGSPVTKKRRTCANKTGDEISAERSCQTLPDGPYSEVPNSERPIIKCFGN